MRYIKVLVLAIFLFLALIFFFQNQAPLSQQMEMTLNLFFIPPMTSIPLPFYFLLISGFFLGCLLTWLWLIWDKFISSSRLMKTRWEVTRLENENNKLQKLLNTATEKLHAADEAALKREAGEASEAIKALPKAEAPVKKEDKKKADKELPASTDAPADEHGHSKENAE